MYLVLDGSFEVMSHGGGVVWYEEEKRRGRSWIFPKPLRQRVFLPGKAGLASLSSVDNLVFGAKYTAVIPR